MDPIKGSLEIITGIAPNTTNLSMTVEAALPSIIPTIVQAWQGLTNLQPATPDPEDPLQVAVWTTQDSAFRPVRIVLWQEPAFEDTAIGQILAGEGDAA